MQNPGQLIVSIDFELFWGLGHRRSIDTCRRRLAGAREAVPWLLEQFSAHDVRATWACVGLLMHHDAADARDHLPHCRPDEPDRGRTAYAMLREFREHDRNDYFAPELVASIVATHGQELASHSYAHHLCLDPGASTESLRADLEVACAVSHRFDRRPQTLVFPRNQFRPEHLDVAREMGFRCFRGHGPRAFDRPRADGFRSLWSRVQGRLDAVWPLRPAAIHPFVQHAVPGSLVDVAASRFLILEPLPRAVERLHLRRVFLEMQAAASAGGHYHLWWHPHNMGTDPAAARRRVTAVLRYFVELREAFAMRSSTMNDAAWAPAATQDRTAA